jgi:hypothetical protein
VTRHVPKLVEVSVSLSTTQSLAEPPEATVYVTAPEPEPPEVDNEIGDPALPPIILRDRADCAISPGTTKVNLFDAVAAPPSLFVTTTSTLPDKPELVWHTISILVKLLTVHGLPPTLTVAPLLKSVPTMVKVSPPEVEPKIGTTEVIVGADSWTAE